MSFIGTLKEDASEVETAVVAGLKTGLNYVDNFVVTELVPDLEKALLAAIQSLGQQAVAALLSATGNAPADTPTPPVSQ